MRVKPERLGILAGPLETYLAVLGLLKFVRESRRSKRLESINVILTKVFEIQSEFHVSQLEGQALGSSISFTTVRHTVVPERRRDGVGVGYHPTIRRTQWGQARLSEAFGPGTPGSSGSRKVRTGTYPCLPQVLPAPGSLPSLL